MIMVLSVALAVAIMWAIYPLSLPRFVAAWVCLMLLTFLLSYPSDRATHGIQTMPSSEASIK